MESTGFPMAVHVSQMVVAASETPDDFVEVGTRDVKGKGLMTTYLLKVRLNACACCRVKRS